MPTIKVKVEGKIATNLTPQEKIVWDNEDYEVEFEFDETWAKANLKTGLFIANGELIAQPFSGNICPMPIIGNTTLLAIGVKSDDGRLYTTTPAYADCLKSASGLAKNKIPAPTQDVYDQIIGLLNKYIEGGALTKEQLIEVIDEQTADLREGVAENKANAENAVATANSANEVAMGANILADSANAKATQALEVAEQGASNIGNALGTANLALEQSNTANSTATEARNIANQAKETANNIDDIAHDAFVLAQSADQKILANARDITGLQNSKQDKLAFDGDYNAQTNKVATVKTVSDKIAEVIAGAPTSFDTLKEIADWINEHPESVAELNALIAKNTANIATNTANITLLNGVLQQLQGNKQDKTDTDLNTTSKTVVGAINEINDTANEAKDAILPIATTANSAMAIASEAKGNAQTALKTAKELEEVALPALSQKVDDNQTATGTAIADTLTNANNYTDGAVNQAVADINTESIEPLQTQVNVHGRNIAMLQDDVQTALDTARGAQQGVGYESYYIMVETLNGADKTLLNKYQSVYIGTETVPDLWVYAIADTTQWYNYTSEEGFANDLITNKSVQVGYFIFKRLEQGKVPLENYYTKDETDDKLEEAIDKASVIIERWF